MPISVSGGFPTAKNVQSYATFGDVPSVGSINIVYIARDTDYVYIWNDTITQYVRISDVHNLGYFIDEAALNAAYPTASAGDHAIVDSTDTVWVWDTGTVAWVDSGAGSNPAGLNTYVQYNDAGNFGGDANFTWNKTTSVVYIDGKLGIGTMTPGVELEVSAGINTKILVKSTTSGNSYVTIDAVGEGVFEFRRSGIRQWFVRSDASNNYQIVNEFNNVKMTILQAGNVGIGTATPDATLEVQGTMKILGTWSSVAVDTVYLAASDGYVLATATTIGGETVAMAGATDGATPPTTIRIKTAQGASDVKNFMLPVRKGDYWEVQTSGIFGTPTYLIYFIPLGT